MPKSCRRNEVRNPASKRCVKRTGRRSHLRFNPPRGSASTARTRRSHLRFKPPRRSASTARTRRSVRNAAVILRDGASRILILKERRNNKWAMPGGKIDSTDKSVWVAAQRETLEETGIPLYRFDKKFMYGHHTAMFVSRVPTHSAVTLSGEHSAYMWASCAKIERLIEQRRFNMYAARSFRQADVC